MGEFGPEGFTQPHSYQSAAYSPENTLDREADMMVESFPKRSPYVNKTSRVCIYHPEPAMDQSLQAFQRECYLCMTYLKT